MLQGLPLPAIQQCGEALRLNPRYASARCLLADCLAYLASYGEAIISYEAAIELNPARPDFLERYGFALASMSQATYDEACAKAQGAVPLRSKRFRSAPHLEAIDKFEQALRLYEGEHPHRLSKHQADYHCRRGHAYLQAGMLDEAVEDFEIGRRLAPDDPELARAYAYTLSLVRRRGNVPGALLQRQPTTDT
jgi:tetratricopeptide (TPR) repeat protein